MGVNYAVKNSNCCLTYYYLKTIVCYIIVRFTLETVEHFLLSGTSLMKIQETKTG